MNGAGEAAGAFVTPSRDSRPAGARDDGGGGDAAWAAASGGAAVRPELALTAGDNSYLSAAGVLLDRNIVRPLADVMRNAPVCVGLGDHEALPPATNRSASPSTCPVAAATPWRTASCRP